MKGHPTTVLGVVRQEPHLIVVDGDDTLISMDVETMATAWKGTLDLTRRDGIMTPRVAVLFGFGINCDHETKAVFELVGASAERIHVNRFVSGDEHLDAYDILAVPGGFSFGRPFG